MVSFGPPFISFGLRCVPTASIQSCHPLAHLSVTGGGSKTLSAEGSPDNLPLSFSWPTQVRWSRWIPWLPSTTSRTLPTAGFLGFGGGTFCRLGFVATIMSEVIPQAVTTVAPEIAVLVMAELVKEYIIDHSCELWEIPTRRPRISCRLQFRGIVV
jgi:hypothetical protein